MVPLGGFLGAKQVALGPLAVEAGIFPFLTLIAISSGIAELHGRAVADRLVRLGFIPLVVAILLALFVLQLPTDEGMRSEEHTSELQSLMRISSAVFCLKKKKTTHTNLKYNTINQQHTHL